MLFYAAFLAALLGAHADSFQPGEFPVGEFVEPKDDDVRDFFKGPKDCISWYTGTDTSYNPRHAWKLNPSGSRHVTHVEDPKFKPDCKEIARGFVHCQQCHPCTREVAMFDNCGYMTGRKCIPVKFNLFVIARNCKAKSIDEHKNAKCLDLKKVTDPESKKTCKVCEDISKDQCKTNFPAPTNQQCAKKDGNLNCAKDYFSTETGKSVCRARCPEYECKKKVDSQIKCANIPIQHAQAEVCRVINPHACLDERCEITNDIDLSINSELKVEDGILKCKSDCEVPHVESTTDESKCAKEIKCKREQPTSQACPKKGVEPYCFDKIKSTKKDACGHQIVDCGPDRKKWCIEEVANCTGTKMKSKNNKDCQCDEHDICVPKTCCYGDACVEGCCESPEKCCPKDDKGCFINGEQCSFSNTGEPYETIAQRDCLQCPAPYPKEKKNPLCCKGTDCCKKDGCCTTPARCCNDGCCKIYIKETRSWELRGSRCPVECSPVNWKKGGKDENGKDKVYTIDKNGDKVVCPEGKCCCSQNGKMLIEDCPKLCPVPYTDVTPNPLCCNGDGCCTEDNCCSDPNSCCENGCCEIYDDDTQTWKNHGSGCPKTTPPPTGPTPSPTGPTPSPTGPTPSPTGPTPSPTGPTPSPTGPTPSPTGPTPSPTGPTPSPTGPTPSPTGPTPTPPLCPVPHLVERNPLCCIGEKCCKQNCGTDPDKYCDDGCCKISLDNERWEVRGSRCPEDCSSKVNWKKGGKNDEVYTIDGKGNKQVCPEGKCCCLENGKMLAKDCPTEECPKPNPYANKNLLCCKGEGCCKDKDCCVSHEKCCRFGCCKIYNETSKIWENYGTRCPEECDSESLDYTDEFTNLKEGGKDEDGYDKVYHYNNNGTKTVCPKDKCCCLLDKVMLKKDCPIGPTPTPTPTSTPPQCPAPISSEQGKPLCCIGENCCEDNCSPDPGKYCDDGCCKISLDNERWELFGSRCPKDCSSKANWKKGGDNDEVYTINEKGDKQVCPKGKCCCLQNGKMMEKECPAPQCPEPNPYANRTLLCCKGEGCCKDENCCVSPEKCCLFGCCQILNGDGNWENHGSRCPRDCKSPKSLKEGGKDDYGNDKVYFFDKDGTKVVCPKDKCCCLEGGMMIEEDCPPPPPTTTPTGPTTTPTGPITKPPTGPTTKPPTGPTTTPTGPITKSPTGPTTKPPTGPTTTAHGPTTTPHGPTTTSHGPTPTELTTTAPTGPPPLPPIVKCSDLENPYNNAICCEGKGCCVGDKCCPKGKHCCDANGKLHVVGTHCCKGDGCCASKQAQSNCCDDDTSCCATGCFNHCQIQKLSKDSGKGNTKKYDNGFLDHLRDETCDCRGSVTQATCDDIYKEDDKRRCSVKTKDVVCLGKVTCERNVCVLTCENTFASYLRNFF